MGQVLAYKIWRNGVKIGRSTDLRHRDWVPRGIHKVVYVVRAVDPDHNLGPRAKYVLYMRR